MREGEEERGREVVRGGIEEEEEDRRGRDRGEEEERMRERVKGK